MFSSLVLGRHIVKGRVGIRLDLRGPWWWVIVLPVKVMNRVLNKGYLRVPSHSRITDSIRYWKSIPFSMHILPHFDKHKSKLGNKCKAKLLKGILFDWDLVAILFDIYSVHQHLGSEKKNPVSILNLQINMYCVPGAWSILDTY